MGIPRNATLAEVIYRDIDTNAYLNEIYASLLYNYSLHLFDLKFDDKEIAINDALRFADLLSKSNYTENADKHKISALCIYISGAQQTDTASHNYAYFYEWRNRRMIFI